MKKIILAFDGTHFPAGSFEFAKRLNALQPVLLTGVFLPQAQIVDLWSYADGVGGPFIPLIESRESKIVKQNIDHFAKLCQQNHIDYAVHKNFYDFALPELKKESCFADLLILSSEVFYENTGKNESNEYLSDALNNIDCPVLVVPEKFQFPESLILAYDGSEDSVFAIKAFAYLFPELATKETLLVYANEDVKKDLPDKLLIEELASRHFSSLTLFKLNVNPKYYFLEWLLEKQSALLVSGSHGRSGISKLFKKSFINDIISDHRVPVFIAHK